jgi:nitroreductase
MSEIDVGDERAFPSHGSAAEKLRHLLAWAVLAPSRHNTQPWTFDVEGDEVRVHADARRALPATDPDGRELVLSCGAAVQNLRLSALHFGHATSLEIVRGHRRDGLVARVRLEERRASRPEVEELFRAIPRRRTNRLPLDGREPPEGLVTALVREARRERAWLRPVGETERRAVAELVAEGDRAPWSSARYRAELAAWTRPNGTRRRDGMPGWAHGLSDAASVILPWLLRLGNPSREEAERDRRRALGSKALLVLSTPGDGIAEWVAAGEALQGILLRATAAGLSASWFGQLVEVAPLRARLREVLGEPGMPQAVIRLGYGLDVRPTPRRPVDEVLRAFEPRAREVRALVRWTPPPAVAVPRPPPDRAAIRGAARPPAFG